SDGDVVACVAAEVADGDGRRGDTGGDPLLCEGEGVRADDGRVEHDRDDVVAAGDGEVGQGVAVEQAGRDAAGVGQPAGHGRADLEVLLREEAARAVVEQHSPAPVVVAAQTIEILQDALGHRDVEEVVAVEVAGGDGVGSAGDGQELAGSQ